MVKVMANDGVCFLSFYFTFILQINQPTNQPNDQVYLKTNIILGVVLQITFRIEISHNGNV